jgi:two-component system, sensor histidine kinase RegB
MPGKMQGSGLMPTTSRRLTLRTIVRLRWIAVIGQMLAIAVVFVGFGYDLPIGWCLFLIALSAWLNIFLSIKYPSRFRLSNGFATALLAYDILQLAGLLYLTGGIKNPFTMLLVAPVTVSAASLPVRSTVALGGLALAAVAVLVEFSMPLPWPTLPALHLPLLYRIGVLAAVTATMSFLAIYAWRITKESSDMSAALAATELILAREQKLHALDGLAAAAAHELGTPLSTIVLVSKELERDMRNEGAHYDDIVLVRTQAQRCREILQKLTQRSPEEEDALHSSLTVRELVMEGAAPYRGAVAHIDIIGGPREGVEGEAAEEPVGIRRPGVLYGIGNLIENATEFARSRVSIAAEWDRNEVELVITDDGPGFSPDIIDNLGEPYLTTRPAGSQQRNQGTKTSGLGLGFFIAKTLLERSGATLTFDNQRPPLSGAVVWISWRRREFEAPLDGPRMMASSFFKSSKAAE